MADKAKLRCYRVEINVPAFYEVFVEAESPEQAESVIDSDALTDRFERSWLKWDEEEVNLVEEAEDCKPEEATIRFTDLMAVAN
jgi:hypothetical protein